MTKETEKFDILLMWGMLFRTLFISFVGIAGYLWMDPQPIGDLPFSELTLNKVFSNLFASMFILGCLFWFFNFPTKKKSEDPNSNPYYVWGAFSAIIALIILIVPVIAFISAPLFGVLQEMFSAFSQG